jgi:hypothetical protein
MRREGGKHPAEVFGHQRASGFSKSTNSPLPARQLSVASVGKPPVVHEGDPIDIEISDRVEAPIGRVVVDDDDAKAVHGRQRLDTRAQNPRLLNETTTTSTCFMNRA